MGSNFITEEEYTYNKLIITVAVTILVTNFKVQHLISFTISNSQKTNIIAFRLISLARSFPWNMILTSSKGIRYFLDISCLS